MEVDLVRLLAESGALVAAIVLMFYWLRRDAKERLNKEEERHEESRMDKTILINALTRNTQVLSELTTLVKRMNHTTDEERREG